MTLEQKQALESAIVADLHTPLTYLQVAVQNNVGMNLVVKLSKKHSLTRTRGRRTKRIKPTHASRMEKGCCPVHGLRLLTVGMQGHHADEPQGFLIVTCPRHRCNALYWQKAPATAVTLLTPEEGSRYTWLLK